jgi:hypothetical protein
MKILQVLFVVAAASTAAFCSPGGVLEKVTKIQVDPTVIEHPENVEGTITGDLVRYNLRAAVKDAHFEEGDSPVHAHFVLDKFFSEGGVKKLTGLGTGRNTKTVDGKLVIQDSSGKELASVPIHLHGSVAFAQAQWDEAQGRHATSDFEQRLLKEIEMLK